MLFLFLWISINVAAATAVGKVTEYFQPGGDNTCQIKFNGQKLTWNVRTYNVNQSTATSSDASSTSSRCKSTATNITASAASMMAPSTKTTATVMPNPTKGKFAITVDNGVISYKDLYISDVAGKIVIPVISKVSPKRLEIELPGGAPSGVYFLRIKIDDNYKIFRIIKL